jgi:hypothetical protein
LRGIRLPLSLSLSSIPFTTDTKETQHKTGPQSKKRLCVLMGGVFFFNTEREIRKKKLHNKVQLAHITSDEV